jgi:hypothetical protein
MQVDINGLRPWAFIARIPQSSLERSIQSATGREARTGYRTGHPARPVWVRSLFGCDREKWIFERTGAVVTVRYAPGCSRPQNIALV